MTPRPTSHTTSVTTTRRGAALLTCLALAAGVALSACGSDDDGSSTDTPQDTVQDSDVGASAIVATDAWARTSPMSAGAGAAYVVLTNHGDVDDALIGVSVPDTIAAVTELHETRAAASDDSDDSSMPMDSMPMDSSAPMMEMVPVDRIDIPAGGVAVLEPGGFHVMLLDLVAPLEPGTTVPLTLTFEVAGELTVDAVVGDGAP